MRRIALILLVALVSVILAGLYFLYALQNLEFEVREVNLVSATLGRATIELTMEVANPSVVPVLITSTAFEIFVNGEFFGKGSTEAVTAPARASSEVTTTLTVVYADVASTMISLLTSGGTATVEIRGEAHFYAIKVPFSKTTTVQFAGHDED